MNEIKKLKKVIFSSNEKTADALTLAFDNFAPDEVIVGFGEGVRDRLTDTVVISDWLPEDMRHLPNQVILTECQVKDYNARDVIPAEALAKCFSTPRAFKMEALDWQTTYKAWCK